MPYYTAQDVCDFLMTGVGGGAQDGEHRAIRSAVHHAYREVCESRDWLWHIKTGSFVTTANTADYDLPVEVENMDALLSQTVGTIRHYISPTDYQRLIVNLSTAGDPFYFTVMRIGTNPYLTVRFVGVPTAGLTFYYTYRKRPTPLVLMGFEQQCRNGTITVAGTSVTGLGTDFPSRAAGGVLRVSGNATNAPESLSGLYPYEAEGIIASRSNATALTLQAAIGSYSGVKYYISDILDVSPGMYTAVLSAAEMWYARIVGKSAQQPMAIYARDLRLAMEQDVTNPISGRRETIAEHAITPRTLGYYSTQLPDQGT